MAVIKMKTHRHTAEYAYKYLSRGISLTVLKPQSKRPVIKEWQSRVIHSPEDAGKFTDHNIGFILGTKSGDLVDIDLDTDEAVKMAPHLLSETPWMFGRSSRPGSHYLYTAKDLKTQRFTEPGQSGGVILEIRSSGAQTMAPGSTHPEGELVRWESNWEDSEPTDISSDSLMFNCQTLAAACLVLKYGWIKGKRDEVALSLCGVLLRAGWEDDDIDTWLEAIAKAAGDDELEMRLKAGYQRERLNTDERVPGIPRLIDLIGKDITDRVIDWLGAKATSVLDEINTVAAIIHEDGKVKIWNRKTRTLLSLQDARTWFAPYKLKLKNPKTGKVTEKRAFPTWEEYDGRAEYNGITFHPGAPDTIDNRLNLWNGWNDYSRVGEWTIKELKQGCYHFLRHLRDYACQGNIDHYTYLLDWMSHLIKEPERVPGVALVLRGRKGTGKTIIANYLIRAIGEDYGTIITNPKHLFGRFNGILRNKLFACIDDIHWSNNHEEEGILKNIITGNQITLEKKFAEVADVKSFLRLMISTNSEWAAPVGVDERRYFILDLPDYLAPKNLTLSDQQREENASHFGAIMGEMSEIGPACLFMYLKKRRLKSSSFIQNLPITKGYLDSQLLSTMNQDPMMSWIQDSLSDATWWNLAKCSEDEWAIISASRMYQSYLNSANTTNKRGPRLNRVWFTRKFLEILPLVRKGHQHVRVIGGSRKKPSTERVFQIPPLKICIQSFQATHGIVIDQYEEE